MPRLIVKTDLPTNRIVKTDLLSFTWSWLPTSSFPSQTRIYLKSIKMGTVTIGSIDERPVTKNKENVILRKNMIEHGQLNINRCEYTYVLTFICNNLWSTNPLLFNMHILSEVSLTSIHPSYDKSKLITHLV